MLPMSSEQQLSSCGVGESPRTFRDRVSSSTSAAGAGGVCSGAGNFKGNVLCCVFLGLCDMSYMSQLTRHFL